MPKCIIDGAKRGKLRLTLDVFTASWSGTGRAAEVEKIMVMKKTLGDYPLAVASGITLDNIREYLPCSDCYLVATGISKSFDELDSGLVQRLVRIVRDYDKEHIQCNT